MKKYISAALLSSFLIASVPLVSAATPQSTGAASKKAPTPTPTTVTTVTTTTVTTTKIEYTLPYPGILPDNPLYFLKQLRDFILNQLIVDPTRKAEFYILQGDKRLGMGMMLLEQKKDALAEETISKGEKYLSNAVTELTQLKNSGKDVSTVVDRLEKSIAKHIEVIKGLLTKVGDSQRGGLQSSLDLLKKLQQDVAKLK